MLNHKEIIRGVRITEDDTGDNKLSILDIKAAIAEQNIPVSELYSQQDLSANTAVISLVHDARTKAEKTVNQEKVVMQTKMKGLQEFKDKTDTLSLVKTSKTLSDKPQRTIDYIEKRLSSGRGVDLTGDLTNDQRQDKVNVAIKEELDLIEEQGIVFRSKKDMKEDAAKKAAGITDDEEIDMTDPKNNPLIPSGDDKD